jgi:hypothetical protein
LCIWKIQILERKKIEEEMLLEEQIQNEVHMLQQDGSDNMVHTSARVNILNQKLECDNQPNIDSNVLKGIKLMACNDEKLENVSKECWFSYDSSSISSSPIAREGISTFSFWGLRKFLNHACECFM